MYNSLIGAEYFQKEIVWSIWLFRRDALRSI